MSERPDPDEQHEATLPRWAVWLLHRLVPWRNRDVVLGDFAEVYRYIAGTEGRGVARRWYWGQVLRSLPSFLFNGFYFGGAMVRNYFKMAVRSLSKRKFFSALNIGGLAIGMGACLLIFQYVAYEYSFDAFHEQGEDLYRVARTELRNGEVFYTSAFTTHGLRAAIQEAVPEVIEVVRVHPNYGAGSLAITDSQGQRKALREQDILYADPSFLEAFTFPLLQGDPATALNDKGNIILSESAVERFFGEADPMGQAIEVSAWADGTFIVTGVAKEVPGNSHLQFDFLMPMSALLDDADNQYANTDGWGWTNFITYVHLRPDAETAAVAPKIAAVINEHEQEDNEAVNGETLVALQPIQDVHLQSALEEEFGVQSNYKTVYFFLVVALFILIIAWVNYINLTTSRAVERAREVGVRKAAGARKSQVVSQFLFESALMNGIALVLAVALAVVGLPYLNQLAEVSITTDVWQDPLLWGGLAAIFGLGALLASLYPAFVLSAFQPAVVLKSGKGTKASSEWLRKGLVVFQFAASMALLTGTYVVYSQVDYLRDLDTGMDLEEVLVVRQPAFTTSDSAYVEARNVFREEMTQIPTVEQMTTSMRVPGEGFNLGATARREGIDESESVSINATWVSDTFLETYGMELVAGRNLSVDIETDRENSILINESAVRDFGFASNEDAIGKNVLLGSNNVLPVVGVLKDFHWRSAKQAPGPVLLFLTGGGAFFSLRVATPNLDETITSVQATYDRVFPGNPFEYFFVDQTFDEQYRADQRFGTLFGIFSAFALLVACLGLIGLAAYTASQRTKEIGVRKVLGASAPGIVRLFMFDFSKLILVALIISAPLMYVATDRWLATFAARIDLSVWLFVVPGLAVLLLALLTVSYHTFKIALTDPVRALRYE
jgi:putative ABC transport system permease protein